jgi:putative molybdopterin biosynthesis protein
MSIYLHDIPLPEAKARLESTLHNTGYWGVLGIEEISLDEHALGRVLAEPVWAKISSPHYHASAMDGFAIHSTDTAGATPSQPITLACMPGAGKLAAVYIDTGDPLPSWADAVIPIENVEALEIQNQPASDPRKPYAIRIRSSVPPWRYVRPMGEDMVATQLVLPAGHTLRPVDLGAIAGCGHTRVNVARQPRVAILPTGSELVPPGQTVKAGEIIEYNSLVLAAQVNSWGGVATRFPIIPDDYEIICQRVAQAALDHDLVLINAGSSAGSEDFTARVVSSLGDLLVHGVAVRPGHPVILGMIHRQKAFELIQRIANQASKTSNQPTALGNPPSMIPVIGVPGYPVSAALTGEIFVEPLLANWLGRQPFEHTEITAMLTRKVTSSAGDDDYMRVTVGRVGDKMLATPLARGSGVITSLVHADGIVILPRGSQGLQAGAQVRVRLYRPPDELEHTIVAIGSHDMTLDLLAQFLAGRGRRLASANVGSLGGLVALQRGETHLAGSHLLDPASGEYNLSYIRQYLPARAVKVVAFVGRQQGLLVLRGNPMGIHTLQDLARPEVRFVNRQRGAGTRVLLDYQLGLLGIAQEAVKGYNQEEYTHLAVAAAVASGRADCGLGIAAAAQALELDFVPLFEEKYELVVPAEFYHSELLAPLWEILVDQAFRKAVATLPGYDASKMGNLIAEVN